MERDNHLREAVSSFIGLKGERILPHDESDQFVPLSTDSLHLLFLELSLIDARLTCRSKEHFTGDHR